MSATPFKLLAAAVLVGGLGLGVGTRWMPTADAQPPKPSSPKPDPQAEAKKIQAELEARLAAQEARRAAEEAAKRAADADRDADFQRWAERMAEKGYLTRTAVDALKQKEKASAATPKWEYDFQKVSDMPQSQFVKFLHDREAKGWEFVGTTPLNPVFEGGSQGKPVNTWVFRRPVKVLNFTSQAPATRAGVDFTEPDTGTRIEVVRPGADLVRPTDLAKGDGGKAKADDAAAIEAEIARLQEKLAALKGKGREQVTTVIKGTLPLGPPELGDMLTKLAAKKFPGRRIAVQPDGTGGFRVQGEKEVVDWAVALIQKLNSDD